MYFMDVPPTLALFITGFSPGEPRLTVVAALWIVGYYWALIAQLILRSFAAACLRGWK